MTSQKRLLELALKGLESERRRIDDEIADLKSRVNGGIRIRSGVPSPFKVKPAGGLTVAGRKKLSDLMKRRWAVKKRASARKK